MTSIESGLVPRQSELPESLPPADTERPPCPAAQYSDGWEDWLLLTWHGDKELHRVPVAVETELRLRHGAVGDEAAGDDAILHVRVDPDRSPRLAVLYHVLYQVSAGRLDHVRSVERDADDDPVAGAEPEPGAADQQSSDPHEGEAQLARACSQHSDRL